MIDMIYRPVFGCQEDFGLPCNITSKVDCEVGSIVTCEKYWNSEADYMRERSFFIGGLWIVMMVVCAVGHIILFWGFGQASERISKRVRDAAFYSLVRQDVSFFDKRNVGQITSELQEDATRIQVFTGDPIRQIIMALSGLLIGLVISFFYMWPFALLAIACIPFMGFASSIEMKQMMGEDATEDNKKEEASSPGGIIVETLINMGTVSALTMEEERYRIFQEAVNNTEENYVRSGLHQGVLSGLSIGLQEWIFGLQFWFGGWLLTKFPERYDFYDLMVAMFALLFGIFSLGAAFQDIADRKETEASANRIFHLIDRQSAIDPLSEEGKTVDYNSLPKSKKKESSEKKKSSKKEGKKKKSTKNLVADEQADFLEVDDNVDAEKKTKKPKSKKSSKKLLDAEKKPKSSKKKKSKKKPSSDKEIAPKEDVLINTIDNVVQQPSEEIVFTQDEDTTEEEIPADAPDFKNLRASLESKSADIPHPKPGDFKP